MINFRRVPNCIKCPPRFRICFNKRGHWKMLLNFNSEPFNSAHLQNVLSRLRMIQWMSCPGPSRRFQPVRSHFAKISCPPRLLSPHLISTASPVCRPAPRSGVCCLKNCLLNMPRVWPVELGNLHQPKTQIPQLVVSIWRPRMSHLSDPLLRSCLPCERHPYSAHHAGFRI